MSDDIAAEAHPYDFRRFMPLTGQMGAFKNIRKALDDLFQLCEDRVLLTVFEQRTVMLNGLASLMAGAYAVLLFMRVSMSFSAMFVVTLYLLFNLLTYKMNKEEIDKASKDLTGLRRLMQTPAWSRLFWTVLAPYGYAPATRHLNKRAGDVIRTRTAAFNADSRTAIIRVFTIITSHGDSQAKQSNIACERARHGRGDMKAAERAHAAYVDEEAFWLAEFAIADGMLAEARLGEIDLSSQVTAETLVRQRKRLVGHTTVFDDANWKMLAAMETEGIAPLLEAHEQE